jgi:hypothetical protein
LGEGNSFFGGHLKDIDPLQGEMIGKLDILTKLKKKQKPITERSRPICSNEWPSS